MNGIDTTVHVLGDNDGLPPLLERLHPDLAAKPQPRAPVGRTKKIVLRFKNAAGEDAVCECVSTIPTFAQRRQIDMVVARSCRGLPWQAYTPFAQLTMLAAAAVSVCLSGQSDELIAALDVDDSILFELEAELAEHQRTFRPGRDPARQGAAQPPRVAAGAAEPAAA